MVKAFFILAYGIFLNGYIDQAIYFNRLNQGLKLNFTYFKVTSFQTQKDQKEKARQLWELLSWPSEFCLYVDNLNKIWHMITK